jgi:hypothetical protein
MRALLASIIRTVLLAFALGAIVACALVLVGCDAPTAPAPSAPAPVAPAPVALVHNLPVEDAGRIRYVCSTAPRSYCTATRCESEIDYYVQDARCPVEPIK